MTDNFWNGFEKRAEEKKEKRHLVRRMLLGNPVSSAISAEKGKKLKAYAENYKADLPVALKGLGVGSAGGAAIGALAGGKGNRRLGAAAGGYLGGILGSAGNMMKHTLSPESQKLHDKYKKKD